MRGIKSHPWFILLAFWPWLAQGETIYQCIRADGKKYATNFPCPDKEGKVTVMKSPRAPAGEEKIPLLAEGRRGQYWIEVTINDNLTQKFLIDTGANQLLIPQSVVDKLTASNALSKSDYMQPTTATMADGTSKTFPVIRLNSIRLGNRYLKNITALVGQNYAMPLLGTSALDRLGNWSIDKEAGELVIESSSKDMDKSHNGTITYCQNLLSSLESRREEVSSLKEDNQSDAKELQKKIDQLKEREKLLKQERKEITSHTPHQVTAWNQKVSAFNKDQKDLQEEINQFNKRQEKRKTQSSSHLNEGKEQIKIFNQKCAGLPYQDYQGAWKEFPTFVEKTAQNQQATP
ncbi:MAG: hypothetical protein G8345_05765 [Magnetococcales bacterium]|nr:retroviral-like aspartic protease family protein [Magnetococcales bacterium]NGZ26376.1 hypothetical protein [Magnetococcales bacterium]